MLAVFPEGISHDEPPSSPCAPGPPASPSSASVDAGVEHVDTVAVTLVYDDKQRFRSRALVRVGEPQPVGRWQEPYRRDGPATVRALTDDLGDRIRRIAPDIDSWRQAERLARMAEIVARSPDDVLPHDVQLAERQRIADALADVERTHGRDAALDALSDAYDLYRRDLDRLGLTDDQVAAGYRSDRLALTALASLAKVAAALPLAAVGVAVHAGALRGGQAGGPPAPQRGDPGRR